MQKKEISIQEANELCIKALILLVKQNLSLKHKKNKVPSTLFFSSRTDCGSPVKTHATQTNQQHIKNSFLELQKYHDTASPKKIDKTYRKLSLPYNKSHKDLNDVFAESQPLLPFNNQHLLSFQELTHSRTSQDDKIPAKMDVQGNIQAYKVGPIASEKLYSQSQLKDLKRDLEIKSRGKICKTQEIEQKSHQIIGYHFYCKNDSDCPFHCYLALTLKKNSQEQSLYRLQINCQDHLKGCSEDDQQLSFMKLTKLIDSMQNRIRDKLKLESQLKPKDILIWMAQQMGQKDHRFIYTGLSSKNYQKAAKKYFDNLIYKIKNPLIF